MQQTGKSEYIIQDLAGCGPFQVILTLCVFFVSRLGLIFTLLFMMFGSYNPGWTCLDNNNTTNNYSNTNINNNNISTHTDNYFTTGHFGDIQSLKSNNDSGKTILGGNVTSDDPHLNYCPDFDSCKLVEFSPEASTIVSEWGLVCRHSWVPSLIFCLQMVGMLVGTPICGYAADAVGRKTVLFGAQAVIVILNTISIFSVSWEMYCILRFFLGFALSCSMTLDYIYLNEFVTKKWRGPVVSIPEVYVNGAIFCLTFMYLRNWRHVHIVTAVLGVVGLIPALWVPESLRWLEVKNKTDRFERAVEKIVKLNGKPIPDLENLNCDINPRSDDIEGKKTYNLLDLFRGRYWRYSLLLTLPWVCVSVTYYAIGFGVKALHGNFYLNSIIMNLVGIPAQLVPTILPNWLGRKKAGVLICITGSTCLIAAACFDKFSSGNVKTISVFVFAIGGKLVTANLYSLLYMFVIELYPTVVRGLASSWCNIFTRLGGVISPFLIPNGRNTLFVCYVVMGCITLVCGGFIMLLPETRGKTLKETFELDKTEPNTKETAT